MSDKNVLIQVKDLKKAFGTNQVLDGITTDICQGEVVAVIGPSGSGKSTFLRSLNLLEVPTGGQILFEGTDITDPKVDINRHRQKIGMVFQQFNLFPHKTVKQNIMLAPVELKLMTKDEASKKADELLARVGLPDKANAYPDMLSGGQKQRLSIARAVYRHPEILIFDDSFSALDFKTDRAVRDALAKEAKDSTKLIVAQRIGTIMDADRIVVLDDGKVVGQGTHSELLENCDVYRQIAQSQLSEDELNDGKSGESKLPGETGKPIETGKPSVESELNESEGR